MGFNSAFKGLIYHDARSHKRQKNAPFII